MYTEELRVADFLAQPHIAVIQALLLQFQPPFLDILPLYIVLLGLFPLVLLALERGTGLRRLLPSARSMLLTLRQRLGAARLSRRITSGTSTRSPGSSCSSSAPAPAMRASAAAGPFRAALAVAAARGARRLLFAARQSELARCTGSTIPFPAILRQALVGSHRQDQPRAAPAGRISWRWRWRRCISSGPTAAFLRWRVAYPGHPLRPAFALCLLPRHRARGVRPFRPDRVLFRRSPCSSPSNVVGIALMIGTAALLPGSRRQASHRPPQLVPATPSE